MKILSGIYILSFSFLFFSSGASLNALPITAPMRADANTALGTCKTKYDNVIASKLRIANIPANSPRYKDMPTFIGAFAMQFAEFRRFFDNGAKKIQDATTAEGLQGSVAEYLSNCSRFSDGLLGFADWAVSGKGPKGFDIIYQGWVNEVKCGKAKCP